MSRATRGELRAFAGALYASLWLYPARTKREAGQRLFERLPAEWGAGTSPAAMARYVGPVFWCPRRERLWFHMAVVDAPRAIPPALVPPDLWSGIEVRETADLAPGQYYGRPEAMPVPGTEFQKRAEVVGCALPGAAGRVGFNPALARAADAAALRIARQIADTGDFAALPILADALEEAGCTAQALLSHCRRPGPHVAGCWVVGLVLGR